MITSLLTAVQDKLTTVESLRYVGEDRRQFNHDAASLQFPCALINIGGFEFEQVSSFSQKVKGEVCVTVADWPETAPSEQGETAFALFDVVLDVQKAIHGLEIPGCEPLVRKSIQPIQRNDAIREYKITFASAFRYED
ncbi:MAG: hypothetical protein LBU91_04230 [Bacteroidales bacterium]|jgi:hypothetical protein|nr:hypothetical protein [Bacteroidales bacterium]